MERGATQSESSEYADLLEKLEAAQESDVVEQALAAARAHLGMDAAYITSIASGQQTVHGVVADPELAAQYQDSVLPIEQTYCMRMLDGEIPNVVSDTRANPILKDLAVTRELGAYVGVPVTLSDGHVHGTLCCVSREARSGVGQDELRFMQILAGIIATRLERARGDLARLTERFRRTRRAEPGISSEYAEAVRQINAARESDIVERALSAARERLGMDAAYIATVDSRRQTIQLMIGSTNADALVEGAVIPVDQTYCARMLKGEIPNIVPDVAAEPALRKVTVIRNIGAYIGVPVKLSDGRVQGSLCCASNDPRPGLGAPELRFMYVLADIVAAQIERAHGSMVRMTNRLGGPPPGPA